jgi:hypothetical protein
MLGQARQHFLYAGGFLGLVDVAEKGEFQSAFSHDSVA